MQAMLRKRSVRLAAAGGLVIIVVVYGLISFLIAQGVTKADRDPQEDHPSAHGLAFEDVEFLSRRGDVTWFVVGCDGAPATHCLPDSLQTLQSGTCPLNVSAPC